MRLLHLRSPIQYAPVASTESIERLLLESFAKYQMGILMNLPTRLFQSPLVFSSALMAIPVHLTRVRNIRNCTAIVTIVIIIRKVEEGQWKATKSDGNDNEMKLVGRLASFMFRWPENANANFPTVNDENESKPNKMDEKEEKRPLMVHVFSSSACNTLANMLIPRKKR